MPASPRRLRGPRPASASAAGCASGARSRAPASPPPRPGGRSTRCSADLDDDELLEAALAKRLRGGAAIADEREFNRLYRYLVGQGFEPDRVLALLKKHCK